MFFCVIFLMELLEAMFLLICKQAWSKNVVSFVGILRFWQSFDKTQRVEETLHYYSSIMLNSFASVLCSKLCWHNVDNPTRIHLLFRHCGSLAFISEKICSLLHSLIKIDSHSLKSFLSNLNVRFT